MKNITLIATAMLLTLAISTSANSANNRIYVKDFAIMPGETKIVEIYVESDLEVRSFQADVQLPDGLSMDCSKAVLTKRNNEHILYADTTGNNVYTIMAFSLSNAAFNSTDGALIEVPVTASNDFTRSNLIQIHDATIEAADKTVLLIDGEATCHAYVARPIAESDDTTPEEPENPDSPNENTDN